MSDFNLLGEAVHKRFVELSKGELFVAGENKEKLWATYLGAFPEGTNPIFRTRTENDCACCANFIKNVANVVAIVNGKIVTLWDIDGLPTPFKEVSAAMHEYVSAKRITGVFRRDQPNYGKPFTREALPDGSIRRWEHFHATLDRKHFDKDAGTTLGKFNAAIQVMTKGLEDFTVEAIDDVLALVQAKPTQLYRGEEHLEELLGFKDLLVRYQALKSDKARTLFIYNNYMSPFAKFANHSIGVLVGNIVKMEPSEDDEDVLVNKYSFEDAVKIFESLKAGPNYQRSTALITPRMVKQAFETMDEIGIQESDLERRVAKLSDVSASNVLWVDNNTKSKMKGGLRSVLLDHAAVHAKAPSVDDAEDIFIDDFMAQVLPKAKSMDVFLKNNHFGNFMTLTAPVHEDAANLFKWDNNFAWSYAGNITDSIKEKVKAAGGNVEGKLRFSLEWYNPDDLDLHVVTPNSCHINWRDRDGSQGSRRYQSGGRLDVDANGQDGPRPNPVENIVFADDPMDGVYKVFIEKYTQRSQDNIGFVLQVESQGVTTHYAYKKSVQENVNLVFRVEDGKIVEVVDLDPDLQSEARSQPGWGLKSQQFVPVQTIMYSPNYWDGNATGNKHWFFMLADCKNPEPTRGIYNEFLDGRLREHRKVFEVLGSKTMCPVADEQLSGLGFSSTKRDSLLVLAKSERSQKLFNVTF